MNLVSLIEKAHWAPAAERLPDTDKSVLLAIPSSDEPVWPGYYDGKIWRTADGFPIKAGDVIYWTPMLRGPQ